MQCNLPRVVVDGESVAVAVDDDAEPAAIVDADAGAAPSLATESPNLLSLKPGNCNLAADMANGVDEEEEEEPNLGGLSTGFLSTAVAEEEAAPPPPLPASDMLGISGKAIILLFLYNIDFFTTTTKYLRTAVSFCCTLCSIGRPRNH